MFIFEADTADDAWLAAVDKFKYGAAKQQGSRAGNTEELLQAAFVIRNPRDRWIASRTPAIPVAFAIVDLVWMLGGRNDSGYVNYWNRELPKFAGEGATYHGAYGYRLRTHLGLDQLTRASDALMGNPESRQVVLQIWDSRIDLPNSDGSEVSKDVPCNIVSLLKLRDGKLHWTQILRSNDMYRGVPINFVQFTSLQEIMAGWLGVEIGTYTQLSDSLHIYENTRNDVYGSAKVHSERNADDLRLPKQRSATVIAMMEQCIGALADSRASRDDIREVIRSAEMPVAYLNLLHIVAADGARRRGWKDIAGEFANECRNQVLRLLWDQWASRMQ